MNFLLFCMLLFGVFGSQISEPDSAMSSNDKVLTTAAPDVPSSHPHLEARGIKEFIKSWFAVLHFDGHCTVKDQLCTYKNDYQEVCHKKRCKRDGNLCETFYKGVAHCRPPPLFLKWGPKKYPPKKHHRKTHNQHDKSDKPDTKQ
ncbi:hypothetical protein ANO11243_081840 [Dothideomycetidae sp. 11243]|nr:hypothetical protein ANO11243_081840 [fungal sp. No.11243]